MEIIAYEMKYLREDIEKSNIICIPFEQKYFQEYMKIYNACFYEMRKVLDIKPYNFLSDYEQIDEKTKDIFLLVIEGEIIGSVACYGSEIDDLIVNEGFQNKGGEFHFFQRRPPGCRSRHKRHLQGEHKSIRPG